MYRYLAHLPDAAAVPACNRPLRRYPANPPVTSPRTVLRRYCTPPVLGTATLPARPFPFIFSCSPPRLGTSCTVDNHPLSQVPPFPPVPSRSHHAATSTSTALPRPTSATRLCQSGNLETSPDPHRQPPLLVPVFPSHLFLPLLAGPTSPSFFPQSSRNKKKEREEKRSFSSSYSPPPARGVLWLFPSFTCVFFLGWFVLAALLSSCTVMLVRRVKGA